MRAALRLILALMLACTAGLVTAQTTTEPPQTAAPTGPANILNRPALAGEVPGPTASELNYDDWEKLARRAEAMIAGGVASGVLLEQQRAQIVDWRAAFLAAQGSNTTRITTLREQIAALGPAPAEGETEAEEIAARRRVLTEQLVRIQAPVLAAEEAYSRADGLIGEIDRLLRERQADELMRLWPMPVNPANWPEAARSLGETATNLGHEVARNWTNAQVRAALADKLPLILGLVMFGVALVWRGRRWFERLPYLVQERASARGREIWAVLASLGQIVVPVLGVLALASAAQISGLPGPLGMVVLGELTSAAFTVFGARWLGFRVFPKNTLTSAHLGLSDEQRRMGRLYATSLGILVAVEALRRSAMDPLRSPESATAVLAFPIILLSGVLLYRMGRLLRHHAVNPPSEEEPRSYRDRLIDLVARITMVAAVIGPLLAAVGYVSAGVGLVLPAAISLALVALLFIVQKLVADIFALFVRNGEEGRDGLVPVLVAFVLTLATLPLFALIWGARLSDIFEVLTRLREGFSIGQTRISPTDFILFALIFALGYMATRLFQGALRSSILPKTSLDRGGQNAILAGTGYVGIFLAALIAINATGIDLSGLAIVAGALSVGIGFGLQNIVSNFVSGIILLIERPVSEGDWIEVGNVQGTVKSISVRSTRIQTFDQADVIVPNTDLIAGRVTNWTRFNLTGRLIVPVWVPFTTDSRRVEAILTEIAMAQRLAVLSPPPLILFTGFGPEVMQFEIRLILRDVHFSPNVRSDINHAIALRFAEAGIEFSNAHRDFRRRLADEAAAVSLDEAALAALLKDRTP
jgi:potassium-dependent mechanosensitive channel